MATALQVDTLETGLRLEPQHAHIARRLAVYDPELRLRRIIEPEYRRQGICWVLERKTRYTKPPDSTADQDVRLATRDGYVIVSRVHVSYLMREEAIIEALHEGDLARQSADERFRAIVDAQDDAKAKRAKDRREDFRHHYAESFDVLDRLGDRTGKFEKTRINNAGVEPFAVNDRRRFTPEGFALETSAGESPAQESSDVHPTPPPPRPEGGELHRRRAAG